VGYALPKVWVRVRAALENYAATRNTITLEEYCDICRTSQLTDKARMKSLSGYLHDLGVILHFHDDPVLKKTIILKPEWGTAAVYKALDTEEVRGNFGRFSRAQLDEIWSDGEYADLRDELLQLMMRFKLCYQIPGTADQYIAPQLLDIEKPAYEWNDGQNLLLRYRYEFMPKGMLTRFIVEMHKFIEAQALVWKSGVVLTNGAARAEVIELYHKGEIQIRVSGIRQRDLLAVISHEIDKINDAYDRIRVKKLIPCNCQTCDGSQDPHFYELDKLHERLTNGKFTVECGKPPYHDVQVRPLIFEVEIQPSENWVENVNRKKLDPIESSIELIESKKEQWPTQQLAPAADLEIFLSYAWHSESETVANQVDQAFQRRGITIIRDDRDIGFKELIKEFMERLGQGKCVVAVVDDKYLKSANCMFELVQVAQNGDFHDRIFPILLSSAKIIDPVDLLDYVEYWQAKIDTLNAKLQKVGAAKLTNIQDQINTYTDIRNLFDELAFKLKNMNMPKLDISQQTDFKDLIQNIEAKLRET
jgi:hypothetical protein